MASVKEGGDGREKRTKNKYTEISIMIKIRVQETEKAFANL